MVLETVLDPAETEAVLAESRDLAIDFPAWSMVVLVIVNDELTLEAIVYLDISGANGDSYRKMMRYTAEAADLTIPVIAGYPLNTCLMVRNPEVFAPNCIKELA